MKHIKTIDSNNFTKKRKNKIKWKKTSNSMLFLVQLIGFFAVLA